MCVIHPASCVHGFDVCVCVGVSMDGRMSAGYGGSYGGSYGGGYGYGGSYYSQAQRYQPASAYFRRGRRNSYGAAGDASGYGYTQQAAGGQTSYSNW